MKNFTLLFLLFILSFTQKTNAFPEMIRHHYVTCTACHFSPSGGGLLTEYGRSISNEVLSTWGSAKEEKPGNWFQIGGDVRILQFHHDSKTVVEGRTIPMQAGLEFVAFWKKITAEVFIGKLDKDWKVDPVGTRFYLMYQFLDELTVRIGRFIPVFGLNIPQHSVVTRGSLGFNQGMERASLEAMWSGEKWNFVSTASQSVPGTSVGEIETSMSTQLNYTFSDSYKWGVSYWLGAGATQQRQIFGLHGALGFREDMYVLTETDLQMKENLTTKVSQNGLYHFAKFGYELTKGVHVQFVEEYAQTDFKNEKSKIESFGPGFLLYPWPHFEFEGLYSKKKILIVNEDYEDYAYLMMHYYF